MIKCSKNANVDIFDFLTTYSYRQFLFFFFFNFKVWRCLPSAVFLLLLCFHVGDLLNVVRLGRKKRQGEGQAMQREILSVNSLVQYHSCQYILYLWLLMACRFTCTEYILSLLTGRDELV